MKLKINPYQDKFLFSTKRFPAMIAAVGTGKSMMLLLKIWRYCEDYPNSLALVVRKEFTDLRDSTIKDFQTYFGVNIDANKEYKFKNGSTIMFRHGGELAVLKNMNLSIAGIEQAEEFETDEVFVFLRDRLRRQSGPYRQISIIANANGHNWIWQRWVSGADTSEVIDERTGQIVYEKDAESICVTANTLANEHNLPADFVADMMRMKHDSPNHFMRYVMNSHDEIDADDLLLNPKDVYGAPEIVLPDENRKIKRVMGVDVARYGNDKTVFTIIEQKDIYRWEQVFKEVFGNKDITWIVGHAIDLERRFGLDVSVVDDVGVGGGVTDLWLSNRGRVLPFIANASASANNVRDYEDSKAEAYFMLKDLMDKQWLKLLKDHEQAEQLLTIRFKYKGSKKTIVSKEEMRSKYKELKSPDMAEALAMAVWGTNKRPRAMEEQQHNLPKYAIVDSDVKSVYMDSISNQSNGRFVDLPLHGVAN